jgi:hypothetical protein
MKKEKKDLSSGGPGGNLAQPGTGSARARMRWPNCGPRRKTARAREGRHRLHGAHTLERAGGGNNANGRRAG